MIHINFEPFPNLETPRLLIRRVLHNDISEILALRGNPETMKFIPRPLCKTNDDALELINIFDELITKNQGVNWGLADKTTNKIIGLISFHRIDTENHRAEIGYMIMPEFTRQGLVFEGIQRLLDFGFNEMKFNSIFAIIDPQNTKSALVLQRNGFQKEAHFKQSELRNDKFVDIAYYGLLKNEYAQKKSNS